MMRFPAGRSSTSTPASSSPPSPSSSGSTRRSRPSPPGKSVAATSSKLRATVSKVSVEAPLHGLGELVAELRDLGQRGLQVEPLGRELLEARLLLLVLLLGERIDLAERLAAASSRSARAASSARSSPSAGSSAPASARRRCGLLGLGLEAGQLDLHLGRALGRLVRAAGAPRPRRRRGGAAPRRAGWSAPLPHRRGPGPAPRVAPRGGRHVRARSRARRPLRAA